MNREESIKLLALIKVAYPTAYKDMDNASKQATVNMWQTTFSTVPYPIMEMAFNRFRLVSKFPPTVAEMVDELKDVYYRALAAVMSVNLCISEKELNQYRQIMEYTLMYKNGEYLNQPMASVAKLLTEG